jgi:hypothetical protein
MALEHAANVDGMYIDESENGLSFHKHGDLLLVSGGWHVLQDFAAKRYPKATEKYHWATQDCISLDSIPYIGPYSASTSGLYVATGFNKWGMTTAIVSAMILSDLVQCKTNPYADVFSPSRSIPPPPAGRQRLGGHGQPAHPHHKTLPPSGLRTEVEPPGTHLGLPLPRLPVCRGRQAHRRSRCRGSETMR